jgi:hypothetical protein
MSCQVQICRPATQCFPTASGSVRPTRIALAARRGQAAPVATIVSDSTASGFNANTPCKATKSIVRCVDDAVRELRWPIGPAV